MNLLILLITVIVRQSEGYRDQVKSEVRKMKFKKTAVLQNLSP